MLPSDMKLKIKTGTVRYNNKILASDEKFILGKNEKVNSLETPSMKSNITNSLQGLTNTPNFAQEPQSVTHNEEKIAFVHFMAGGFAIWNIFYESSIRCMGHPLRYCIL